MMQSNDIYQAYLQILREELIPAMGCTEPIAIAYGASYARDLLGELPDSMVHIPYDLDIWFYSHCSGHSYYLLGISCNLDQQRFDTILVLEIQV